MTVGELLPALAIAGLFAASGPLAPVSQAAVGPEGARLRAAIAQQRDALQTLPGVADTPQLRRALTHLHAALADLLALEADLTTRARQAAPIAHLQRIETLLDNAYSNDNHAAAELLPAIYLSSHGYQTPSSYTTDTRTDIHQAQTATAALVPLLN